MSGTLSITQSQTLSALRGFLQSAVPSGVEIVQGQENRVPEPKGVDFISMIPIMRERLETNVTVYTDGGLNTPATAETRTDIQPTRVTVQVDVHGPNSADNAQAITTLFRSDVAVQTFSASGYAVSPLYCSDPRQIPFSDGEQQIEERWEIDAVMQVNPGVTTAQQFAGSLSIGTIVNVTVKYPT